MNLHRLSVDVLRDAGYTEQAERLAGAVRRARAWRRETPEHVIALSLFGSVEYDSLIVGVYGEEKAA